MSNELYFYSIPLTYYLMIHLTFLQATAIGVIVQHYKAIQFEILLLHQ